MLTFTACMCGSHHHDTQTAQLSYAYWLQCQQLTDMKSAPPKWTVRIPEAGTPCDCRTAAENGLHGLVCWLISVLILAARPAGAAAPGMAKARARRFQAARPAMQPAGARKFQACSVGQSQSFVHMLSVNANSAIGKHNRTYGLHHRGVARAL